MSVLLWLLLGCAGASGQVHRMPRAADGLLETGVPNFLVRSQDGIGLSSPPTDMRMLPDGRLLIHAPQEIALGDGNRWEIFRQAPDDTPTAATEVAVDSDGSLYMGVQGGFARVDFGPDGRWRLERVEPWQTESPTTQRVPGKVIQTAGTWLWHAGSGAVAGWRPGQHVQAMGRADTVEHAFLFKGSYYLSDHTNGQLARLEGGEMKPIPFAERIWSNETITCAIPFGADAMLVGTQARGVQLFDGQTIRPFASPGLLDDTRRINALCDLGDGTYVAAIERFGLVFFDRDGRTLQTLESSVDHRLAHTRRLIAGNHGIVWGLLADGILKVGFPSRISHYEPLFQAPVITAHVNRLDGRLWMDADGQIRRAVYDDTGRLTRLEAATPREIYATSISCAMGVPVIGSDQGAFFFTDSRWIPFASDSTKLRILSPTPVDGRWLFGASQQVGWLRLDGDRMEVERFPAPGLDNLFNADVDRNGTVWIEMGSGRAARVQVIDGRPQLEVFDSRDGLPMGWVQLFVIDGIARFNVANQVVRYEEATSRFVVDPEFTGRLNRAGFRHLVGRPGRDARGRLWVAADGAVHVLDDSGPDFRKVGEAFPQGLTPYFFTFEEDGKVWMQSEYQLSRYDPDMAAPRPASPRAMITRLTLAGSGRVLTSGGADPISLDYTDNSLTVHFVAIGAALESPVGFEVMLEGAESQWSSVGAAGSTSFKDLREGRYRLRVRPLAGGIAGGESSLGFVISPPWFRTGYAYAAYVLAAFSIVFLASRISSYLERREKERLERLVAQRTRELNASRDRLASQVETIRALSQAIEQSPVAVYLTDLDGVITFSNPRGSELLGRTPDELIGRRFGELRDPSLSAPVMEELEQFVHRGETWRGQLANRRKDGQVVHVHSTVAPIRQPDGEIRHLLVFEEDITAALAEQERHARIEAQLVQAQKIESIGTLAGGIAHDFNNILTAILGHCELVRVGIESGTEVSEDVDGVFDAALRAKELVGQILTFSRHGNTKLVPMDLAEVVAESLKLLRATTPATIEIKTSLKRAPICGDVTQIQQIVINLCTNAVHALADRSGRLEIEVTPTVVNEMLAAEIADLQPGPAARLVVRDNGSGIDPAILNRIFDPFFTTKAQGEGTGLGLSIVQGIVASHLGAIRVESTPGTGTAFELYFPIADTTAAGESDSATPTPLGDQEEIVVVDDEPAVIAFMTKRLRQLGYRPTVFTDPREAISAIATDPKKFRAVITDFTMPHITGVDLLHRIRLVGARLPAVVITGHGQDAVRSRLDAFLDCVVLPKPFTGDELARALNEALASEQEHASAGPTKA